MLIALGHPSKPVCCVSCKGLRFPTGSCISLQSPWTSSRRSGTDHAANQSKMLCRTSVKLIRQRKDADHDLRRFRRLVSNQKDQARPYSVLTERSPSYGHLLSFLRFYNVEINGTGRQTGNLVHDTAINRCGTATMRPGHS